MRFALAFLCALSLHGGFIVFGKILFPDEEQDQGTTQEVELLEESPVEEEEQEDEQRSSAEQELETEVEEVPDAAEIIEQLELSAAAAAPALDAASLSAIEQALSGLAARGDFADALSFSSGGRIGGLGSAATLEQSMDQAFSLAEIDQKPRPIIQAAPLYPAEMRGKKIEGVVTLIFVVDSSGKVIQPRVEKSSHPAFEKPALEAVKQWKFEPAVKGGQRVSCKMRAPIRFQPS
jgi:protein TonB